MDKKKVTTVDRMVKLLNKKKMYDDLFYGLLYDDYQITEDLENRMYKFSINGFHENLYNMDYFTKLDATIAYRTELEDAFFNNKHICNENGQRN